MSATIVNLTNVGPYLRLLSPCLVFGTIKCLILTRINGASTYPWGSRQPAPHMGQVDAGETVSHNIQYPTYYYTSDMF